MDFNVGVATSHLWRGLVINDGMTAMGFVHLALDENQNFTTGVWVEQDLMEITEK
jgi:hypothetical protein